MTTVTLIPGDGITRDLTDPVLSVLDAAGAGITFEEKQAGIGCIATEGAALPEATLDSIRKNKIVLKGKLLAPPRSEINAINPNTELRRKLGLYAAVRPLRNLRGLDARHKDVDIVLIREISEDIYAGLEHQVRDGVVATMKVVTEAGCERISRIAFEYARRRGRKRVSLIHKANIMKITDGLFIRCASEVATEYSDIEFNTYIVDNACMQLLQRPHQYDVMLMGNLYGDIMSDLGAGIVGGISATMGAMLGAPEAELEGQPLVFEALHGEAPELMGTGAANPLPLLMPAVYMLEHLDLNDAASRIKNAISDTLEAGIVTADLGGSASTDAMTQAIIDRL